MFKIKYKTKHGDVVILDPMAVPLLFVFDDDEDKKMFQHIPNHHLLIYNSDKFSQKEMKEWLDEEKLILHKEKKESKLIQKFKNLWLKITRRR